MGAPEAARKSLDQAENVVRPVLDRYRFEAESGDLVEALAAELLQRGLSVAAAESCTGGLVAKRMTDRPGSSGYCRGGIIAYANDIKSEVLGIESSVLEDQGAVSEAVAEGMARGVAERLDADIGIGVTGIAGPDGGTEEKPVGTVWYAVSYRGDVSASRRVFPGDRQAIRLRATQAVLHKLFKIVTGKA